MKNAELYQVPTSTKENLKSKIRNILRATRKLHRSQQNTVLNKYSIYFEKTYYNNRSYNMPFFILETRGCRWYENSGCSMCGYSIKSNQNLNTQDIINQIDEVISLVRQHRFPMVHITPSASFFDDQDLPLQAREHLFERLRELNFLEALNTESRAEFLTDKHMLKKAVERLDHIGLSIAMGLESIIESIREICVNKNLKLDCYIKALKTMKKLGIHTTTYVLVKPPFLTEREAIDSAVNTIRWALKEGSDLAVVMLCNVQPYSLVHLLWKKNLYRVPWLWSVVKIFNRLTTKEINKITFAGLKAIPNPIETAHNCTKCTQQFVEAIESWKYTRDISYIRDLRSIQCGCREEWEKELKQHPLPLEDRIRKYCDIINEEVLRWRS